MELKPSKTKVVHTLKDLDGNKPGFDFLGFNVRQYPVGKYQSGKNSNGEKLGFKTIIKPSSESVKRHYQKLADTIKRFNAAPQIKLISELNPIIRGWCNYFRTVCSKETFTDMNTLVFQRLKRWAYRRHPNKNKHWVTGKYWKSIKLDNWVFGTTYEENAVALIKHAKTKITRHVKVIGEQSPYDGNTVYWTSRMGKYPEMKSSIAEKLKKQKGKCSWCNLSFQEEDVIEDDHIISKRIGGSNKKDNRQLLHRHCHDSKTRIETEIINEFLNGRSMINKDERAELVKVLKKSLRREEPCEAKVSCTVLKTSQNDDILA